MKKFFLETGNCKFGGTYKYHHPHDKNEAQSLQLNILGLPILKDEKSCPYYMKTGSSKFGVACKFNHPQPTNVGTMFPVQEPSVYGYTGSCASAIALSLAGGLSGWPLSRNSSMSSSKMNGFPAYMPLILPPTEATMPMHWGWSTYMVTLEYTHTQVAAANMVVLASIITLKRGTQVSSCMHHRTIWASSQTRGEPPCTHSPLPLRKRQVCNFSIINKSLGISIIYCRSIHVSYEENYMSTVARKIIWEQGECSLVPSLS
ncbi:hypothetical protein OPV22_034661 [Ensete ventricosum]|uniref:C3H1-type domain-containing protein n=1 Tax=Ensete ventricosum TaxID=4639 RepID=A0AAV8PV87_ENSVE|nr:hypothetical protein OPV22_034661 [Ensete ventricosum]